MKKLTNITKKVFAVSICLIIYASSFSQEENKGFGGWSVSLHSGYALNNSRLHWNSAINVTQVSNLAVGNTLIVVPGRAVMLPDTSMHNGGVAASFHIGYKKVFSHFFAGAEFGFGSSSLKASQTSTFYPETMLQARNPLTIQRDISSGISKMLDVKFGYIKGQHLVYAMGGIAVNPVKISSTDDYQLSFQERRAYGVAAPGSYNFTSVTHNQQEVHSLIGISWGIGYQYLVSGDISVGIEFRQTGFGTSSYTTNAVTGEQPTNGNGARIGIGGALGESTITTNLKQQVLTAKVEVALSAIFKKK